jgi:hypothetical protein
MKQRRISKATLGMQLIKRSEGDEKKKKVVNPFPLIRTHQPRKVRGRRKKIEHAKR